MDAAKALSLRIKNALKIAEAGTVDGASHKMWVIDQMVRSLTGCGLSNTSQEYNDWVIGYEDGDDGPNTYEWDMGVES